MQGPGGRPVCMDCVDQDGPSVEYICSAVGCDRQPRTLAVLEDMGSKSVLVCAGHFEEIRDSVITYVELPEWLTDGSARLTREGDLMYHFDLGPNGD